MEEQSSNRDKQRLKVLFLPTWYPSEGNPVGGIFIKEHARAASLYNDIVVLYAYPDLSPQPKGLYRVSEDIEGGIRTIRVRYGGILAYYAKRWLAAFPKPAKNQGDVGKSDSKSNPALSILKKPLRISFFIAGDLIYCWSIFAAFRKLRKGGWKPDIIHAHVYTAGVPAVLLGRLYKIPVVITEHWSGFPRRLLKVKDKIMARFAMNRVKLVLPVSDNLREAIEKYGIKSTFRVVPNAANIEMFSPLSNESRKNSVTKRILMVAVLTPVKGVPYLLEALHRTKEKRQDFVLDIVGDGPNRSEYEKQVNELGLGDMVKFHGLKTKEEVAGFMRQCDFFVLPSLWENLPCVLIEAMSSGVPVIATDVGGVNEMIDEKVGVLIPPKDVEALEKAIQHLLNNYSSYSPREIAEYANDKFSYEAVGKQLDVIYREVLVK